MKGGTVTFFFDGDTKDIEKKSSSLGSTLGGVASGIGSAFIKGTAVAGTALTGLIATSVNMKGQLEQNMGGAEAVFQDFAKGDWISASAGSFQAMADDGTASYVSLEEMAKNSYATMGTSANEYMATINKMGSLMQGSGISIEESLNLSAQGMQRAADVASIMGIDVNTAMEAMAGAAKGNFTMMDNLGVSMNATSLEAYALSQGITTSYNEMDQATKIQLAYQMFLDKTQHAVGNYAKENETFSGSLTTLKAAFGNFMSGAGDIDAVVSSLTSFAKIALKSIVEMAPKIIDGIIEIANAIAAELPTMLNELLPIVIDGVVTLFNGLIAAIPTVIPVLLPALINGFVSLIQGLVASLPALLTALIAVLPTILTALINGFVQILQQLTTMLPTILPQIVQAILGIIPILIENLPLLIDAGIQFFIAFTEGLINSLPILIDQLPTIIDGIVTTLSENLPKIIAAGIQILVMLTVGIIKEIPNLVAKIPGIIADIVKGFVDMRQNFIDMGLDLIKGLWEGIKDATSWILKKIEGFCDDILGGIAGFFGIHSPSREFAYIGRMNVEGMMVGTEEMQGDLNSLYTGMLDLSPQLYGSSSASMSPNITVDVNNSYETDPLGQMVNKVKTFAGGSKNDYNYGSGV